MVKFSKTLFIMYFSGRCLSLLIKLVMYSHIGERLILYTNRPLSNLAYSVCQAKHNINNSKIHAVTLTSTFSTTCLPKEHTLVEQEMVILSVDSY